MNISRDLMAASAKPVVLSLLRDGDSYGYAMVKRIDELSKGSISWKEGMLYPLLHRLEQQGLIESYSATGSSGRARKYYRLLPKGADELVVERRNLSAVYDLFAALDTPKNGLRHASS